MQAISCHGWFPNQDIQLEDIPSPTLGPGKVRIGVHYASVSLPVGFLFDGGSKRLPPRPFSQRTEIAGEILEIAPGVTELAVGDRVCAIPHWGAHAEEVVIEPQAVYRIPASLPFHIAPLFPISYASACLALTRRARLQPGETLLVHGAAGSVGLAAVEVGKALGAKVIATAATAEKRAVAASRGADATVAFPSNDAVEAIKSLAPSGVDVSFDPVGGDAFDLSERVAAHEGRVLLIGFSGGQIQQILANLLLIKNVDVLGFNFGIYTGRGFHNDRQPHAPIVRSTMETIFRWYEQGKFQPATSHRFPLTDYVAAMDAALDRQVIGKIVLEMPRAGGG